jgi:outer membrane protein insertion porin family
MQGGFIRRLSIQLGLCAVLLHAAFGAAQAAKPAHTAEPVQEGHAAAPKGSSTAPLVKKVRIEGLRRVDREAALVGTKLRQGKHFDAAAAAADLHALWRTGFFRDVSLLQEAKAGGVELTFVVEEKPSIKAIAYTGLDAVSEDDVKGVVNVKAFTILNVELLKKNIEKIKDLYVGKGYYLVEVTYELTPSPDDLQEVTVTFNVVENAKVMVRQVSLVGNRCLSSELLKNAMQTREGNELSFLTQSGTYKEDYFQTDLMRLQALYYDHGYVTVKIGEPTATISKDRREIYLSVPIEEGQAYDIGAVEFSGDVELKDEHGAVLVNASTLRKLLTIRPQQRFNRTALFNDVQALTDVYRDQGYAYANVTPNSRIDPATRTVTLDMEVDRGDLAYFETIEMVGNTRTRDKVIRRELRLFEGQKYSAAALNLSRARVFQLGYFETVNISTARGSAANKLTVSVEVKEKSTGTFQIGAGLSSYESFIATAQISQNNFLGNGQMMALSMHLSFGQFAQQLAQFQFQEPYFLDSQWALGINAYLTQRYFRDFQRNSKGFTPSLSYPLTHELRLSAGYTFEYVTISTDIAGAETVLYNLDRAGKVSAVNASLSYDNRDNRLFPTHGTFDELRAELSTGFLGADDNMAFKRFELDMRFYHPLPLRTVFRLNMQLGYVFGPRDGVPISERYFPGGIYSVRGFSPRGLGPIVRVAQEGSDPMSPTRDFTFGGNKQAIFNLELEFPIVEAAGVKGVVFVDAGNAYNDDESMFYAGTPKLQRTPGYLIGSNAQVDVPLGLFYSFGFGVRWLSPIGPLRFEWGIPITKHAIDDEPIIFEFTIGNFF